MRIAEPRTAWGDAVTAAAKLGADADAAAARAEADLLASCRPALQALVFAACVDVCGAAVCATALAGSKAAVLPVQDADGPDLRCAAPHALYRRLRAAAHGLPGVPGAGGIEVTTVSPWGALRVRSYASAEALAEAVLESMDPAALTSLAAGVRIAPGGALLLTTRVQHARQRAAGRLPCAACGRYYAAGRGLRDHSQRQHGASYIAARDAVTAARLQLIPGCPGVAVPTAIDPLVDTAHSALLRSRATAAAAAREMLPPACVAARDGDVAAVSALGRDGCVGVVARDRHGSGPMHWAAGGGHVAVLVTLVDTLGAAGVRDTGADGRTPLMWAARNGRLAACRWLVARGADANASTRDGTTAFHWAVWQGRTRVAAWLAHRTSADVHAVNSYGCNASQWAAQAGDCRLLSWLGGSLGLNLRMLNANGHSALHKAAVKGRADACAWLLAWGLGGEHLRPDGDGNTPEAMARAEGFTELADSLRGAAVEAATAGWGVVAAPWRLGEEAQIVTLGRLAVGGMN